MDALIKQASDSQSLHVLESKELEIKHPKKENKGKTESKMRKVLIKTALIQEGIKEFLCSICDVTFETLSCDFDYNDNHP